MFFFKGLLLGLAIAAPVGPIAVLCIRRTLQYGRLSGFFSGLGAASADTFYGIIAAFGFSFVSELIATEQKEFRLLGGAFLFFLGVKTFFSQGKEPMQTKALHKTLIADFLSTFFLTLSNPMTILSFLAVFAAFGLSKIESWTGGVFLISGIFIGASGWWLFLSEGISWLRKKVTQEMMTSINRLSGLIMVTCALIVWLSSFHLIDY